MEKEIITVIMDENDEGMVSLAFEVEDGFKNGLSEKQQEELFSAIGREIEQANTMKEMTSTTERVLEVNVRIKDDMSKDSRGRERFGIAVQMRPCGKFDFELLKERLSKEKYDEAYALFDKFYKDMSDLIQGYYETAYDYIK